MQQARLIVQEIVQEIEKRVFEQPPDQTLGKLFADKKREIEDRIALDFSRGIPHARVARIRELLGNACLEYLDQNGFGPFARKGKERIERVYRHLACIAEMYRYYEAEAAHFAHRNACLEKIKTELIEAQISHVDEVEQLEKQLQSTAMLVRLVLEPFEQALSDIMAFLQATQLEVFLFDDDRFLAQELKTDGHTFIYNKGEESLPSLPEAVSELQLNEVKETMLNVPLSVENRHIGHFRITRQTTEAFDQEAWKREVTIITPVLGRILEAYRNSHETKKVYIDDLTQLYNKRKLNDQMGKLFKQFKRGDKQLFIAMMDIDRFKSLNDKYGHPVGDEILRQTAAIIKEMVPYAYRYGGEEFAAIFYGYTLEETIGAVEKLRIRIEQTPYSINGQDFHITISAGIAEFETNMNSVMDAIDQADQALYASKEDGRNRTTYFADVKDRLSEDASRLRQEMLQLRDEMDKIHAENKRLAEQLKKTKKSA
ncbi:MAG: GGDEF domain-containing protein [Deltaproteobacteria bacterium]|nr:GGDEF domain-containing protein [Deltaproteobacteria bacterium]